MEPVALYDQMLDALRSGRYGPAAVAGTVIAVFSLRVASARWWARAPWAWLRGALRWCAGGPGGALLGAASALGVEVLAQAAGRPLTLWVLASAAKTWLISMGVWAGAKNLLPPVARGAARRKARMGPAAVAALLGLCLLGGTPAQARDWTPVFGDSPKGFAPAHGSILDGLSLGVAVGWDFQRRTPGVFEQGGLAVDLVGVAHLADVRGWTLSIGFSGGLLSALRTLTEAGASGDDLTGGLGFYALPPARPGAPLRVALGVLLEGGLAGAVGGGLRFALFM